MQTQPVIHSNFNSTHAQGSGLLSSKHKPNSSTSVEKGTKNSYYLRQQLQANRAKQMHQKLNDVNLMDQSAQHRKNHSVIIQRADQLHPQDMKKASYQGTTKASDKV